MSHPDSFFDPLSDSFSGSQSGHTSDPAEPELSRSYPPIFRGERRKPFTSQQLAEQRPILAKREAPPEHAALLRRKSVYVTGTASAQPQILVTPLAHGSIEDRQQAWRVDIELHADQQFSIPSYLHAVRQPAHVFRQQIKPDVSYRGHRPEWLDHFYLPRTMPRPGYKLMQRFNGAPVRPQWVFGDYDPQLYRDASYPWGCIGLISNSDGATGSGVLVGRNIVVTAGHMIPWHSGGDGWVNFVPADYLGGGSLFGKTVSSFATDAQGFDNGDTVTGYDWAILRLAQPLGEIAGYMGYNSYDSDWEDEHIWAIAGYPGGVGPFYQNGVSIDDDDDDVDGGQELETTDGDTLAGNSGSPLFAMWGTDPRVVGVVSGEETEYKFPFSTRRDNVIASGSGFTDLIAWGRSNW